ncbi:MAG TPA: class I SAM-dependent methyltransferase [Gemmataceae bacterium]|jgi:SAM-dependent methyltransferase|nr:class I SAM-dependent methyltransferase [Gemmataceae bacterium]
MLLLERWVEKGFRKREPWVTRFVVRGKVYGGGYDTLADPRLQWFCDCFPDARTILELGSLEGGHTWGLATRPGVRRIVALEGRAENVRRARFAQKRIGYKKARFYQEDLESCDLSRYGTFDAVFCVGLLYHLTRPWELLAQVGRVSAGIFIWTHYVGDDDVGAVEGGYAGAWVGEFGQADPLSGLSPRSFWPTRGALKRMLADAGFANVRIIEDTPAHPHGPAITLAASRE